MTIGGLSYTTFKPETWSEAVNAQLRKIHIGLSITNSQWRGEIRAFGDVVNVLRPGSVTSRAYTAYGATTFEQPSASSQTITVDQADYAAVDVDDIDVVQSRPDVLRDHASEAAYSLNDTMDSFVFSAYAAAGSGVGSDHDNPLILSAVRMYAALVDAGKVLDENNVPTRGRFAALSNAEVANLRSTPWFTRGLPATEAGTRTGWTGHVGQCAGFSIYETNNLTTLSGVRKCLAGHDAAIGFAGPVIMPSAVRRELRFADAVRFLSIYGKTVIESSALAVIHGKTT